LITVWPSRSSAKRAIKKALAGNDTERSIYSLPRNQWPSRRRKRITTHSEMCTRRDRASPLPLCRRPVHLGSAVKTTALLSLRTCSHGGHMKGTIRNRPRTWILPTLPAAEYTPAGWIEGAPGYSTAWRKRTGAEETAAESRSRCKKRELRTGGSDPGGSLRLEGGLRSTPSFARDQICDSEKMGYVNLG